MALNWIRRRVVVVMAGLLLIALVIWFIGPYVAVADVAIWESVLSRVVTIAVVFAIAGVWALVRKLRAATATSRLASEISKPSGAEPTSEEAQRLRTRFEEAVAALQRGAKGRGTLYDLPWYVFVGAPGSGKTTALVNSGLKFSLEQSAGRVPVRGVGGTRNCDWWFTDEAVFLDTAGRYTTQDSDAAADRAAWSEFLALLCKYRKRRPLNGVIVVVSAHDLLNLPPNGREAHVEAIRRRLDELSRELKIQIPVYVVVTKLDLLAGFTDYFDDLQADGRKQVWGVTFPYEQTRRGGAVELLVPELDLLIGRLNERLAARLNEEQDPPRRARIFGFPQQVAVLRSYLGEFIAAVFGDESRAAHPRLLRGVYLTSGTQDGTPIDRLLSALSPGVSVRDAGQQGARGKAYFIERLLKHVLLGESGLAGINRRLEWQQGARHLALYVGIVALAVLATLGLWVSHLRNSAYLRDVAAALQPVAAAPGVPLDAPIEAGVARLDAVRNVADVADRYQTGAPLTSRMGLFQGTSIGHAARDAYTRELNTLLSPRLAQRIGQRLQQSGVEPDILYEYLKAYLMLGRPEHLNRAQVGSIADLEWRTLSTSPDTVASVSGHFARLVQGDGPIGPVPLDPLLVAKTRNTIRSGASIPALVYSELKLSHNRPDAGDLRLDVSAGVGAERVLRLKSGRSLSQPIPRFYTAAGLKDTAGTATSDLVKQFAADAWVWGEAAPQVQDSSTLRRDVMNLYEADYISVWDRLLNDIEIVSASASGDVLAILAAPTSPLRALLKTVDANTYFEPPTDATAARSSGGMLSSVQQRLRDALAKGTETAATGAAPPVGARITEHFKPIHDLVAGPAGGARIDKILEQLDAIRKQLLASGGGGAQADLQVSAQIRALQQDAALLPRPVGALIQQAAGKTQAAVISGVSTDLRNRYRQEVLRECTAVINGRYPFSTDSATDVPLGDFGRLFGYGGVFDKFFTTYLQPLVDDSRSPWSWRPGTSDLPGAMPRQFEAAQNIRAMFFRSGAQTPEVSFVATATELDTAATRFQLDIDGQRIENRHGPERPVTVKWPGQAGGQVAVSFEDRSTARPNRVMTGAWAWFRMLDFAHAQRESDLRSVLRFDLGGHTARVTVDATSVRNPFANRTWQRFSCGEF